MIRECVQSAIVWMKRVVTQPRDELNRWQRTVRFAYDLMRHGAKQLTYDRASQMAAALAFRSLFALLPVLIVATIVVKAIKGTDAFLELTHDALAATQLADLHIIPPADSSVAVNETITLAQWLEGLVAQATGVNLAALGWIGFGVITYAAISLMVTIENSFNTVYRAPEGRPWVRRVPLYWFVLTISPVVMGVAWYFNSEFSSSMEQITTNNLLSSFVRVAWNVTLIWVFLFCVYVLIPNTSVAIRPAVMGALVSSILFEIGRRFLGAYLENAFAISHLYGSLGLIPLFMFWCYLMWLAVLFGLELSATLQMLPGRNLDEVRQRQASAPGLFDAASVITVLEIITERFQDGKSTASSTVADLSGLPDAVISPLLQKLVQAGLVHRVETGNDAFTLARPPEQISASELIDIGYQLIDGATAARRSPLVDRLRSAQRRLAAETTLATLGEA